MSAATSTSSAAVPPQLSRSALLLDRRIGRSTPDSEALASSDEEHDPGHMTASLLSNFSTHSNPAPTTSSSMHSALPKPTRRPSWLSEIQPNHNRKPSNATGSLGQLGSIKPQSTSPAATDSNAQSPSATANTHTSFPFSIPLQPTIKPHRSASYSVGQREGGPPSESNAFTSSAGSSLLASAGPNTRSARPSNVNLTRRASRLPTLPDLTEDRRDSHNMDSSHYSIGLPEEERSQLTPSTASAFQHLHNSKSNSTLRRQVTVANADRRHRGPLSVSAASGMSRLGQSNTASPSDYPDMDSFRLSPSSQGGRRFSENAAPRFNSPNSQRDWPNFFANENFGIIDDDQGRRHSLAEGLFHRERSNSIATATDEEADFNPNPLSRSVTHEVPLQRRMSTLRIENDFDDYNKSESPHGGMSIGTNMASADVGHGESLSPTAPLSAVQPYFQGPGQYDRTRNITSDNLHSNPYAVPATIKSPAHILYIVLFKCSRADVFYVPENVGLDLAIGDCVIVDGDRGFDLGMVTHCNITLEEAKRLLKDAAIANYRWLTMFSEHERRRREAEKNAGSTFPMPTYATLADVKAGFPASMGGMGSMGPQQSPPSPTNPSVMQRQNINPKPIRRKAEAHEIQVLKDKEAGEAKAKRVCQAKALELGLQMEILDAEFQIDFRRLTFYYYAQSYVNFNSLVGELFKIYKTRIWMSAVNPESFQQAPPSTNFGLTPGAVRSRRQNPRQAEILPAGLNGFPPAPQSAGAPSPPAAGLNSASFNLAGQNLHQFNNGMPPMMHQNLGGFSYANVPPPMPTQQHFPPPMHRQGSNESAQNGTGPYAYFAQPPAAPASLGPNPGSYVSHNPPMGSISPYPVGYPAIANSGYYGGYSGYGPSQQNPRSSAFMNSPVHHGSGGYGAARQPSPREQLNGHVLDSFQGLSISDQRG